ncbi:MAG: DUF1963 domain-containing protein [Cyanobacteria bacterium J06635_1]
MDTDLLKEIITYVDSVAAHSDFILGLAKPCVKIKLADGDAVGDAGSRFGGHPYLPSGFQWPTHDVDKLMVFIETEKLAKRDFGYLKSDAG